VALVALRVEVVCVLRCRGHARRWGLRTRPRCYFWVHWPGGSSLVRAVAAVLPRGLGVAGARGGRGRLDACAWGPTAEGDAAVAFRGTLLVPGKELASGGCSGLGMAAAAP
jgi:hypothetical protein